MEVTWMSDPRVKIGILVWPQYTDWASLREAGATVDRLGFDSLWTWDHLYPICGSPDGPIFEGYLTLAGWACVTERVTLGLMVGANTFRNPALVAKMVTTLDHMSGGRAILGVGAAWFKLEHEAYGFDFGSSVGERLNWLDEAVMIVRGMLDGTRPSGRSRYRTRSVRNEPPPAQRHLPILIGGAGEKKTLATVARYADIWNVGGDIHTVRHKDEVLSRWCEEVGRDSGEIERTLLPGVAVVRGSEAEARRVLTEIRRTNRGWEGEPEHVGTPDQVVERLAPYLRIGFHSFQFDFPPPFDQETLERLAFEVRPRLAERLSAEDPSL
jgi:alkanesulfonate monooxygenase SsuD/methylene tetrahydromethanopterin reductase-like flavin-dependent oxidoreductase (luciferase family)